MYPLISIIVPIYNVEKYLERCLNSLVSQTYENIEIILIDDGSSDHSGTICDSYQQKDERIKVIHQQNLGLSAARNVGIRDCVGKYIGFVDSDDWIDKKMYETLYVAIDRAQAQIACCGYWVYEEKSEKKSPMSRQCNEFAVLNRDQALHYLIGAISHSINNFAWNKLYEKRLFDTIFFPEGELFEDSAIMYQLFDRAMKITATGRPLYVYTQRKESIVNSHFHSGKLALLKNAENIINYSEKKNGLYHQEAYANYAKVNLFLMQRIYLDRDGQADIFYGRLINNIKKIKRDIKKNPYIPSYDKWFMKQCLWINPNYVMKLRYKLIQLKRLIGRVYNRRKNLNGVNG